MTVVTLVMHLDDRSLATLACSAAQPGQAREAFQTLYARYRDEVFRFLLHLVRERELAEDAFQETFMRAHRKLGDHDPARSFKGWIFRIVRNTAVDMIRSQRKQRRVTDVKSQRLLPQSGLGVVREAALRETVGNLHNALASLSEYDRALLIQRHGQGQKLKVLAEAYDCTERTVRNHLRAAAQRLTSVVLAERRDA